VSGGHPQENFDLRVFSATFQRNKKFNYKGTEGNRYKKCTHNTTLAK